MTRSFQYRGVFAFPFISSSNHMFKYHKGRYTYDVHENCVIFENPQPLSIYVQNFSTLLTLDVLTPLTLPHSGRHMCITPKLKRFSIFFFFSNSKSRFRQCKKSKYLSIKTFVHQSIRQSHDNTKILVRSQINVKNVFTY